MSGRFTIARLGVQGDGVADTERGPLFIPFTLPGETVTASRVKDRAELMSLLEPSPQRVAPPCRHFTVCGGCALQHMEMAAYLAWKRDKVSEALRARGIKTEVAPTIPSAPASRRRALFSAHQTAKGMLLGYHRAFSHEIVDIEECPILVPEIAGALAILRALAARIPAGKQAFHLTVTRTDSGLDVAVEGSGAVGEAERKSLSDFVLRAGLARLTVGGDIVLEPLKPHLRFGTATVTPPPGGFLQAVATAEDAMAGLVSGHLGKAKKLLDLFAGSGTFALRLAAAAPVHAVEGDAAALAALDRAFRAGSGLRQVTVERRDLFRRPLFAKELDAFDGLVFDPPRAGAEDQCKQIARSEVPKVAAVSCNPTTLARDVAILVAGGYTLKSVTPIDQFLWSPHVEAVALLEKPKRRR